MLNTFPMQDNVRSRRVFGFVVHGLTCFVLRVIRTCIDAFLRLLLSPSKFIKSRLFMSSRCHLHFEEDLVFTNGRTHSNSILRQEAMIQFFTFNITFVWYKKRKQFTLCLVWCSFNMYSDCMISRDALSICTQAAWYPETLSQYVLRLHDIQKTNRYKFYTISRGTNELDIFLSFVSGY